VPFGRAAPPAPPRHSNLLSHTSIVAREYGTPAVIGTGIATRRIANGQIVTVDGDLGIVTLGEPTPEP
jgi:phosphoenolpyruvate synthase/pyruvate phosphate dikinase